MAIDREALGGNMAVNATLRNGDGREHAATSRYRAAATIVTGHWLIMVAGVWWQFPSCWPRPHPSVLGVSVLSALGVVLVVLLGLGASGARRIVWPILLMVATSWICAKVASGARPALAALAVLGLSCTLSAAGSTLAWRVSSVKLGVPSVRTIAAALVGGIGWLATVVLTRDDAPGVLFPALITIPTLLALTSRALRLDGALAGGLADESCRLSKQLLAALWLGIAALAAASLAAAGSVLCTMAPGGVPAADAWPSAVAAARLGWLNVLPVAGMALVIFAGRLELVGRAILVARHWGALALLSLLGVAAGAYGVTGAGRRVTPPAVAGELGGPEPGDSIPARVRPPESAATPAREAPPDLPGSASAEADAQARTAPPVAEAEPEDDGGPVRIQELSVKNVLERDVRLAIERRLDLLAACRTSLEEQRAGTVSFKVRLSAAGGVTSVLPAGGDLEGTELARCMMLTCYRMGFAAPGPERASFVVTFAISPKP